MSRQVPVSAGTQEQSSSAVPFELNQAPASRPLDGGTQLRWLIPVAVVAAIVVATLATGWHGHLSVETLMAHRATLHGLVNGHRLVAVIAFIAVYTTAVALSVPGGALLTTTGGFMFGTLIGGAASVTAATLGATVVFVIVRYAAGGLANRLRLRGTGPLGAKLAERFRDDAFCYIVFLRLVPFFPFWLINLASAPAGVALVPFVAATAIGIIPASFAFAFFGAGLNDLIARQEQNYQACLAERQDICHLDFHVTVAASPELIASLIVLGLLALIPPAIKAYRSARKSKG